MLLYKNFLTANDVNALNSLLYAAALEVVNGLAIGNSCLQHADACHIAPVNDEATDARGSGESQPALTSLALECSTICCAPVEAKYTCIGTGAHREHVELITGSTCSFRCCCRTMEQVA